MNNPNGQLTALHSSPTISLIMTVYNEGQSIRALLECFLAQTRQPDEIIIVDGGSTDDTVMILREYASRLPLKAIGSLGCTISQGRNIAIQAAAGDVIAVTDAGTRPPPEWLANLVAPLAQDPDLSVSAGFFHADPHTPFEVAMGATVLPLADEIDPDVPAVQPQRGLPQNGLGSRRRLPGVDRLLRRPDL